MENVLEISVTSSIIWTKYGAELKLCCTVLTRIKVIKWSIDAELGSTFEAKYFFMVNILCLNHLIERRNWATHVDNTSVLEISLLLINCARI